MKPSHGFSRRSALLAILISSVLILIIVGVALAAAPYLIDHFTSGNQNVFCLAPCTITSTVAAPGVPGGTRDISITAGGTAGRLLRVLIDPGNGSSTMSFNQETFEAGTAHIEWDGNGNPDVFNPTGLNPRVDLTQGSTNTGIELRIVFDDSPINVTIRIYTDGTHWSDSTMNLLGGITTAAQARSFFLPFSGFTARGSAGGATFTTVGAITMDIDGTVTAGADMELDIFEAGGYDFGDLPAGYGVTTVAENGARHLMGGLRLGSISDAEENGIHSPTAVGDNNNPSGGVNDEEGVAPTPDVRWVGGGTGSVNVTVTGCSGTCYLNGWIDWGANNNFTNNNDVVFADRVVTNGLQSLTFTIPNNFRNPATLNARFRLCGQDPVTLADPCNVLTGAVYNGEVEDYQWQTTPTAITSLSLTASSSTQNAAVAVLAASIVAVGALGGVLIARRRKNTI